MMAIVMPNTLTLFTRSSSIELTVIASNWCCVLLKSIGSSSHLSGFSRVYSSLVQPLAFVLLLKSPGFFRKNFP